MADRTRADRNPFELRPSPARTAGFPVVSSLPAPRTSFVGRAREITAGLLHLREGHGRLLTLTGPGGVGKTRLAIRIAETAEFPDGVAFAPLATIAHSGLVTSAIAAALGVEASERSGTAAVVAAINARRMLLVLDNFEQILESAAMIAELLEACPRLVLLVTSRVPLRISGEQELPVPPLALPADGAAPDEMMAAEAVRLFAERATAVDPAFALTSENAPAVAAVCQRLDGLPLAVELAAAKIRLLPPSALQSRLARGLPLLDGGPRDAPARLRTMRGAIAWSYDLLAEGDQTVFRRLAVFVGGFTFDAAKAVAGAQAIDPLGSIMALAEQSLIRRLDDGAEPRFGMLETVRKFGLELLAKSGELRAVRDWHAAWIVRWAEELAPDPAKELGPDQGAWLLRVGQEFPNLQQAIAHLIETGQATAVLELLTWLDNFWTTRVFHRVEVRRWAESALEAASEAAPELRAGALHVLICALGTLGEHDAAVRYAEQAVGIGRQLGDSFVLGRALYSLGLSHQASDAIESSGAAYAAALPLFRQIDAVPWIAQTAGALGAIRFHSGDVEIAIALLDESLALYRQEGQAWGVTLALAERAHVALAQRDLALAVCLFGECLVAERDVGNECLALGAAAGLAGIAIQRAQPERAARLLGAIAAAQEQSGIRCVDLRLHTRRIVAQARAALTDDRFQTAWTEGHGMSTEGARAEAAAIAEAASTALARAAARDGRFGLTPREREVLHLLVEGRSDREIAGALFLSRRTAQTHVSNIFAKLGVGNRTEASATAHREGLV